MSLLFSVAEVDPRPPPIIHQGPQNQTLPINSIALLQCLASGEPAPSVRWYRNNRALALRDPRFTLLDSGTLQISGNSYVLLRDPRFTLLDSGTLQISGNSYVLLRDPRFTLLYSGTLQISGNSYVLCA